MNSLSPRMIAWLLPVTLLFHQIEEYTGHFPQWYSRWLNADLSESDFIVINAIGLILFTVLSLSYTINRNNILLAALGTLVLFNGLLHLVLSIITFSYSPGLISGIVLFIPLGLIIYKRILPVLKPAERFLAISIGVLALLTVSMIARSI